MSLLDDLKKQAEEKAKGDQGKDNTGSQKHDKNWHMLAPKMHIIFNYMKELADNLNIVSSDSTSDFNLTKTIIFKNLKKRDFKIAKNKDDDLKSFIFRYDLVGERNIPVVINNMPEAEKVRGILNQRLIKFTEKVENKNRIIISVIPKIRVQFKYTVDLDKALILLQISNFDTAWDQTIRFTPDVITNNLMEETAKYILLEPNHFMEMSGNTVSDDMREKLREVLKKDGKIKGDPEQDNKSDKTVNRVLGMFKK